MLSQRSKHTQDLNELESKLADEKEAMRKELQAEIDRLLA
jgi:hypothetical protein